ncbi:MAG: OadG family protein [Acidaminococcaceae bacterium]
MNAVTTNPFMIAIINMTIVFSVLYVLGIIMHVIRWVDQRFVCSK